MVQRANEAADLLAKQKISCTVVDPRTTSPMDTDTILECVADTGRLVVVDERSEEHTSELQSLMRNSYAVFCLKKKNTHCPLPVTIAQLKRQMLLRKHIQ